MAQSRKFCPCISGSYKPFTTKIGWRNCV